MGRYAIIRDGTVERVIVWDPDRSRWQPPADVDVVPADDDAEPGATWDGRGFTRAPRPDPPPDPMAVLRAEVDELRNQVADLSDRQVGER